MSARTTCRSRALPARRPTFPTSRAWWPPRAFGPGAEIAASIMDGAFLSLEAPIQRVTSWDVPFPGFAREKANVPDLARVLAAARETLAF